MLPKEKYTIISKISFLSSCSRIKYTWSFNQNSFACWFFDRFVKKLMWFSVHNSWRIY